MKNVTNLLVWTMMVSAMLPIAPIWAQADANESSLETVSKNIDREHATKSSNVQVQVLAKEFNVPPSTVEDLRSKKQGWGDVTVELAMAQHLSQTDPKTYPTLNDALKKIEALRGEQMGWGKIAKNLGFKLGPVVSAAEHTRQESVRDIRADKAQKLDKVERVDRPDRGQGPERPERPERPHR